MINKVIPLALLGLSTITFAQTSTKSLTWSVKKTEWSSTDEKSFQEFVRGIGRAKEKRLCSTTENCIKNKDANPQFFAKNPSNLKIFSDCADLPYILRGYFAWMNNLPFSFPVDVSKADPADTKPDIRYSRGNKIQKVKMVKTGDNVNTVLTQVADAISSAMFRVHPDRDVEASGAFTDFYSPAITKNSIRPGTVVYDPNGHVLVVYDIADDGRILMIDAHPDNSLTRQTYGDKFVRDNPRTGSGFKNWRPVKLVEASADANGNFVGGRIVVPKNSQILDYSKEQYVGHSAPEEKSWKSSAFILNGEPLNYYEYVRRTMAKGNLKYHPVIELREMLKSLCEDLKDRKNAVDDAIKNGIQNNAHPAKLPDNIYGTVGEWESYSTPSRDARLKAAVRETRKLLEQMVTKFHDRDPIVEYDGNDLVGDLKRAYSEEATSCSISYNNSLAKPVALTLDQVIERIFALSFDPYHCIELRWGASGNELASCKDNADKKAWYSAEQSLRNSIDRNYDIRMDKTASELTGAGLGAASSENISIKKFLDTL